MTERPRFIAFSTGAATHHGLLLGDRIVDLAGRGEKGGLLGLLAPGAMRASADRFGGAQADYRLDEVRLEPPLPGAGAIFCIGVNFPDRAEEYGGAISAPAYPSLFMRLPASFTGHGQPLIRPTVSEQLDYEGEIAILIGKAGRHIAEADALDHVAALTLCNEGSVRDWMRHGKFNVTQGKNFDRTASLGPWLVPYEDEAQIADIRLTTRVNGDIRQDDRTSRMLFGIRRIISYISTFTTLQPGAVISTGTPSGAGARSDPPVWLKPGDIVEISADGLGTLSNGIADEGAAA